MVGLVGFFGVCLCLGFFFVLVFFFLGTVIMKFRAVCDSWQAVVVIIEICIMFSCEDAFCVILELITT